MFALAHGLNARGTALTHGLNPHLRVPTAASSYAGRVISTKYEGRAAGGVYEGKIKKE